MVNFSSLSLDWRKDISTPKGKMMDCGTMSSFFIHYNRRICYNNGITLYKLSINPLKQNINIKIMEMIKPAGKKKYCIPQKKSTNLKRKTIREFYST